MSDYKTAADWAAHYKIEILDPDGWRQDNKSLDDRIGVQEFLRRIGPSTITTNNVEAWRHLDADMRAYGF